MNRARLMVELAKASIAADNNEEPKNTDIETKSSSPYQSSGTEFIPPSESDESATTDWKNPFDLDQMPKESADSKCRKYLRSLPTAKVNKENANSKCRKYARSLRTAKVLHNNSSRNEIPVEDEQDNEPWDDIFDEILSQNGVKDVKAIEGDNPEEPTHKTVTLETVRQEPSEILSQNGVKDVEAIEGGNPEEPTQETETLETVRQEPSNDLGTEKTNKNSDPNLKHSRRKKKIWDKRDLCPYCFDEITHFARHLLRRHKDENDVKNIEKFAKKDPKRKELINALRKKGNFTLMTEKNVYCPVRRPDVDSVAPTNKDEYMPCNYCLGLFKKNYLYRHVKVCTSKPPNDNKSRRANPVGDSQTLLAISYGSHGSFLVKSRLKLEVFPIMAADMISKTAKSDPLICIYGEAYLNKHKRKQIANKVSNEIREFARLLITLREITDVSNMFDALKPDNFEHIINAVKIISGYNPITHTFKSASLALHMRTNLMHLCEAGERVVLQKHKLFFYGDRDLKLKEIKELKKLITGHYRTEISSLALKDLNEKKWNKVHAIPKTNDIELFQKYVGGNAEEAYAKLQDEINNAFYYQQLVESTLALTVIINRKRVGEVQYLTIETYKKDFTKKNHEEFMRALTKHEIELSSKFKRVVTGGKGSRPVTILFPQKIQKYVDCLINVRNNTDIVPKSNLYLFALPRNPQRWMSGYHTIKKLAIKSKIQDPQLMTSTRFRKHLATILQILNFEKDEMEQIARFMGHTTKTHEEFYRLSEDIYQTSKVAKVLMIMNQGKGEQYRGQSLKDIDVTDELIEQNDSETEDDPQSQDKDMPPVTGRSQTICNENIEQMESSNIEANETSMENVESATEPVAKRIRNSKDSVVIHTSKGTRKRWTNQQKKIMDSFFKKYIADHQAPKKQICEEFKAKYKDLFKDRDWVTIKTYVYNCNRTQ